MPFPGRFAPFPPLPGLEGAGAEAVREVREGREDVPELPFEAGLEACSRLCSVELEPLRPLRPRASDTGEASIAVRAMTVTYCVILLNVLFMMFAFRMSFIIKMHKRGQSLKA